MRTLIIIPARAGSKGLPGKNTKLLGDKPLVVHTIIFAQQVKQTGDVICISTNDEDVIRIAEDKGIRVPFKRPEELSSDSAGIYEVILHAIKHYRLLGVNFEAVLLLQPTSPFRLTEDYKELVKNFQPGTDMVVTVKHSKENPYFTLFEEDKNGYLEKSKKADFTTRQECPPVYTYNGSMYLISVESLLKSNFSGFTKIKKLVLPDERSVDIDTIQDWILAEYLFNEINHK
jgi:CMP-N,N'-diacetyllegionaminic acid synthase